METLTLPAEEKVISFAEELGLPKKVLFGDEWIELDESMFYPGLCPECRELGYCKKNPPPENIIPIV